MDASPSASGSVFFRREGLFANRNPRIKIYPLPERKVLATIDSSCDGTRARVERRASIPARANAIAIVHLWCARERRREAGDAGIETRGDEGRRA